MSIGCTRPQPKVVSQLLYLTQLAQLLNVYRVRQDHVASRGGRLAAAGQVGAAPGG